MKPVLDPVHQCGPWLPGHCGNGGCRHRRSRSRNGSGGRRSCGGVSATAGGGVAVPGVGVPGVAAVGAVCTVAGGVTVLPAVAHTAVENTPLFGSVGEVRSVAGADLGTVGVSALGVPGFKAFPGTVGGFGWARTTAALALLPDETGGVCATDGQGLVLLAAAALVVIGLAGTPGSIVGGTWATSVVGAAGGAVGLLITSDLLLACNGWGKFLRLVLGSVAVENGTRSPPAFGCVAALALLATCLGSLSFFGCIQFWTFSPNVRGACTATAGVFGMAGVFGVPAAGVDG